MIFTKNNIILYRIQNARQCIALYSCKGKNETTGCNVMGSFVHSKYFSDHSIIHIYQQKRIYKGMCAIYYQKLLKSGLIIYMYNNERYFKNSKRSKILSKIILGAYLQPKCLETFRFFLIIIIDYLGSIIA